MSTPVIEWSIGSYRGFDPATRRTVEGSTLEEVYEALGRPKAIGLALSRRVALLKQITLPDTSREQQANIVNLQMDQLFPIGSSELTSDFQVLGKNGAGVKALVVAVRTDTLRQALDDMKQRGVSILWVAPTAMSSSSAARDAGATDGVVMEHSSDGLGFDVVEHGYLTYSRNSVPPDSIAALEHELNRTISTVGVDHARVIAVGGMKTDLADSVLQAGSLELLAGHPPKLDLVIPEDRAKAESSKTNARRRLAVLLWAAVVACGGTLAVERVDEVEKHDNDYKHWSQGLDSEKKKDSLLEAEMAKYKTPQDILTQAFEPKQKVSDILAVLNDKATDSLSIGNLTYERGKNLSVRGTAINQMAVSEYASALSGTKRFRDLTLQNATDGKVEETPVVQFAFTTHVVGNYPIYEKKKVSKS